MHARKQQARIDSGECVENGQTSTHRAMLLSRKMTWNTKRHDPSTINSHPTSTTGHAPPTGLAAPTGRHVTLNLHPPAPDVRCMSQHGARMRVWTSGDGAVYGRSPAPGLHARPGCRFGITGVPGVRRGSGGSGRACPWQGGRQPGATRGMVVAGRGIMVSIRRGCFSTSPSLNRTSSI